MHDNMFPSFLENHNFFLRLIEFYTGANYLYKIYEKALPHLNEDFFWVFLAHLLGLNVKCVNENEKLSNCHRTVYYSNHPTGLIDGVAIASLLNRNRIKFKIVVNSKILEAWDWLDFKENNFIGLDVYGSISSRNNIKAIKNILQAIGDGDNILIFPSGAIGRKKMGIGRTEEEQWSLIIDFLIKRSSCNAIPVYVNLHPSVLFSLASIVSKHLRYALIYRETRINTIKEIHIDIGQVALRKLKSCISNHDRIGHLSNA